MIYMQISCSKNLLITRLLRISEKNIKLCVHILRVVVTLVLRKVITSVNEVMFSPGFVCEFVCEQDNSKTYGWILMKFSGYV